MRARDEETLFFAIYARWHSICAECQAYLCLFNSSKIEFSLEISRHLCQATRAAAND